MAPTLLKTGVIVPHMKETKNEIANITGIEFILKWFSNPTRSINDKILVLKSATGSGKSTVLPSELYLKYKKNIVVSQPRVLTAVSIPNDIVNIPVYKNKLILYNNIGFQTKEYIKRPVKRGILFCTIGIILQKLINSMDSLSSMKKFIKKHEIIIIDEAHIRTIDLDMVMYYLKKIYDNDAIQLSDKPYLVITSATIDIKKYSNYFNTKSIIEIIGVSHPIETIYPNLPCNNLLTYICDTVKDIMKNDSDEVDRRDIILFVQGSAFSSKVYKMIEEEINSGSKKIYQIILDSENYKKSGKYYRHLMEKMDNINKSLKTNYVRKIIISTNVAEIGITIDSLKYCIDTGLLYQLEFNPYINSSLLLLKNVTKSMVTQRKGRVGRHFPGIFYPLYDEKTHKYLQDMQYPDIYLNDITRPILNILMSVSIVEDDFNNKKQMKLNINKLVNELIDSPSNIAVSNSINKLYTLGFIDENINPTFIGRIANKSRMSLENIKMIMASYVYGCNTLDIITIAAFILSNKGKLYDRNFKSFNDTEIDKLKSRILIGCDFIEFLLFFNKFKKLMILDIDEQIKYCEKFRVSHSELMNIIKLREEMIFELAFTTKLDPLYNNHIDILKESEADLINEISKIKRCLYEGYKLNVAIYDNDINKYKTIRSNTIIGSINSTLIRNLPILKYGNEFESNMPKVILYDSLLIRPGMDNYEITVSHSISILSGYIQIDPEFN